MPYGHNGDAPYEVHYSEAIRERLRKLQRQATHRGQGQAFLSALRRIVRALQRNPTTVGEPLYYLSGLHLHVRTVVVAPLVIDFGVHVERRLVFIRTGQ